MSQQQSGEKTEKPTPERKKKARKDGQIARTNDLGAWLTMLAALYLIPLAIGAGYEQCRQMLMRINEVADGGEAAMLGFLGDAVLGGTLVMAPIILVALVLGVVSQVAQIGWAPAKVKFDVKKLNIFKGIKGMFGAKLIWESAKNIIKLAIIVALGIGPIETVYSTLVNAGSGMNVMATAGMVGDEIMGFLRAMCAVGFALAAFDYMAAKKRTDKQIKMTKQEVKQEHKQQEGDPMVKGQRRQVQLAMSRNRMMAEVPQADVILVNPTHLAVALRYDPLQGAPVVLAKGAGVIADRIRELAAESDIPVVRDVPLARTVYRLVDVGHQIPFELYEAIARVLAFVYALRTRGRATGTHDSPFADLHAELTELPTHRPRTPVATTT
jgi:flagellar biosynthesis protein FlhB